MNRTNAQPRLDFNRESPELVKKLVDFSVAIAKSGHIEPGLSHLVDIRASQMNGCAFCLDMHSKEARMDGERELRLYHVAAWRESQLFTPKERAALAFTEEGTRLADAEEGVSDETWEAVRKHYDDDQVGALVWLVAMINSANRVGVILHNQGGSYEPGMFAALD